VREIAFVSTAIVSALLTVWMGVRYCRKVVRGDAHPPIATWFIFEIGIVMSLITYLTSHEHNVVKSITNAVDLFAVGAIFTTLLVMRRRGEKFPATKEERENQRWCFRIITCAFLLWAASHNPWVANVSFQVVMIVAYWPMVKRLRRWREEKSPEPFDAWAVSATASFFGLCAALIGGGGLAVFYPLRSVIFCCAILRLIKQIERRNSSSAI